MPSAGVALALRGAALLSVAPLAMGAFAIPRNAIAQPAHDVKPPTVVQHVDAIYPPSALATRKHGDVVLLLTVDADGHVSKVDVASESDDDLNEAASVAARQWTFSPALRDGVPIASRIRLPFHFAPPAPPPEVVETQAKPNELSPQPASEGPPAATPNANEAEEVRVAGRRSPPSRGASDFDIRVGQLAQVPRTNATEMLKLAPGILLTNEGGEGHAEQVFLRGFDAREGQDIEFSVGGVPINESGNLHGNGYADTHFIIPELVESLRVVEGPFDPRQGNYAVAGSANYELGLDKRGLTAKYTAGSWGTQRLLLTWGPPDAGRRTFAGVEAYKTDGFGQNRDATRGTAMGQYEGKLGNGSYRITATAYATHFHSAGVLREDDYRSGRIGFYDSYDLSSFARQQVPQGGDASRFSIAGDLDTKIGDVPLTQQVFVIKRDMRLLEDFTGFLLDVQEPLQSLHAQRGDMLDLNVKEMTIGARGSSRIDGQAFGQKQSIEFGYFARADETSGTQERIEASTGHPYKTETNLDADLTDIGLYADANLRATPWLNFRGGGRVDVFAFNTIDHCAVHDVAHPGKTNPPIDQSCLSEQDNGRPREPDQRAATASAAFLPRGSLILGPFKHVSFNASYGQGVRSIDPSYITQDVKTPFASIKAYEGGVAYAGAVHDVTLVARSIFFQTHVDRDLIFSETAGRNVLGVGTTRTGWVGALRLTGAFFDESANVTLVRSAYDDTHLLVAYVPNAVFRSDTALFADLPWTIDGKKPRAALGVGITYVGPRALPFGERSQDIFTTDAQATLGWSHYEIALIATNLFDRKYRLGEYNYASDSHSEPQPTLAPERHFTAGAPRGIFASFAVNFGGS